MQATYSYHGSNSAMISFSGAKIKQSLYFKIDSGAAKTILPMKLFKHFKPHVDIKTGEEVSLKSASGHIFKGYAHKVFIRFDNKHSKFIKAVFCDSEKYLLGLDSIRERFESIVFNKLDFFVTY